MRRETVKAAVSMALVVALDLAAMLGFQVDGDALADAVYAAVMLAATAWGCWKNHNFTAAAQEGQRLVDELKAQGGGRDEG